MILLLKNGTQRLVSVSAPTMGLSVVAVTFESHDLQALLKMDDLHEYLGVLSTRFVPAISNKEKNT